MSIYAEEYGYFFDSSSNDRTYSAGSFEDWLKPFFTTGVFTGGLQVTAQSTPDMTVNVSAGFCFTTEDGTFAYREDYDVGDIVSVRHNAWGYINSFRITAIEEDYEEGGTSIVLTCGTTAPETVDFEEE